MGSHQPSEQARKKANSRKEWNKVEQHLSEVEKTQGFAKAWKLREQLELGNITLAELTGRR